MTNRLPFMLETETRMRQGLGEPLWNSYPHWQIRKGDDMDEYTLKTIEDILQIPEDRLDAFFVDLKIYLELHRGVNCIGKIIAKGMGKPQEDGMSKLEKMVWKDDGKNNMSITLQPT